ncbi:hypothetical protein EJD97_015977 [Solanum chilense]|uniref:Uncharacterized protein n=1 Tax=Solanum chilense TaxID=4083 RepID=A0A6N2B8H1_SOLCI|nr:hypothetical protein EJD97_015977 [Solanum chilense]
MTSMKVYLLLLSLMVINFSFKEESRFGLAHVARPIYIQQHSNDKLSSYLKMFETLGMVCMCCDGAKFGQDLCSATWDGSTSCSNLKCLPWKFQ